MENEMKSLYKKQQLQTSEDATERKVQKNKCVYNIMQEDENLSLRSKVRNIVKYFSQTHGVDYNGIFSPKVKVRSIRVILYLAAHLA